MTDKSASRRTVETSDLSKSHFIHLSAETLKMNTLQSPTKSSSLATPNILFYNWVCHG